jgi:hypothetical protein
MLKIGGDFTFQKQRPEKMTSLFLGCLLIACSSSGIAQGIHPYSTSGPIDAPRIFAAGVISTELPEFATAFSPAGDMVVFNRMPADRSRIDMFMSRFENGKWSEAELLPFSGEYRDVDPWISSDGSRLYFSSTRPGATGMQPGNWDTWYVRIDGPEWSEPVRLGPEVNTAATEIFVSMTDSGTLYFRRSDSKSRGIFSAQADGDGFAMPQELRGLELESAGNPMIARDGSFLILSGNVEGRAGELFISFRDGDQWTPAVNMGPSVNTQYAEFAPGISPDGKYLFFTSERPGIVDATAEGRPPGDIYQVELSSIEGIEWPE